MKLTVPLLRRCCRVAPPLPSSRELTHNLHMSSNTVVAALNQLAVEGYLVSHLGSGTLDNILRHPTRNPVVHARHR